MNDTRSISHTRSGFSLLELLTVIGIIAVLMALLLPVLSRAREQSRQLKCALQLHQLGIAMQVYATNNHGYYPGFNGYILFGRNQGWTEILQPSFGRVKSGIYNCPSFPPEFPYNYFLAARWTSLHGQHHLLSSDVHHPSLFILSGDATALSLYPPWFGTNTAVYGADVDKDDALDKCLTFYGESGGFNAHRSGNNVLFGDYHVQPFKKFDRQSMTYDPQLPGKDWPQVKRG